MSPPGGRSGVLFVFLALLAMASTFSFALGEVRIKALCLGAVLCVLGESECWVL